MSSPPRRPRPGPRPEPAVVAEPSQPAASAGVARGTRAARIVRATGRAANGTAGESGRLWREAREARRERARREPRLDVTSWLGAGVVMTIVVALIWVVQIVNAARGYSFNHGLYPRTSHGLWSILLAPWLHASYDDMLSDTLPVLLIGWVVLLAGVRIWIMVTAAAVLVGGALAWAIAPGSALLIGGSGLVFGWLGYLVARAIFSRKIKWIVTAAMVLLIFGALLGQLVPVAHGRQAWQVHVAGFVAGAAIALVLHPRRRRRGKRGDEGRGSAPASAPTAVS